LRFHFSYIIIEKSKVILHSFNFVLISRKIIKKNIQDNERKKDIYLFSFFDHENIIEAYKVYDGIG